MISHYHEAAIAADNLKFEKVGHIVATRELLNLEGFECKNAHERILCLHHVIIDHQWTLMAHTMYEYKLPDGHDPRGITVCLSQEALDHINSDSEVKFKTEIIEPERFSYHASAWIPDAEGLFEDMYIRTPLDTLRAYVRFRRVAVMPNNECERLVEGLKVLG